MREAFGPARSPLAWSNLLVAAAVDRGEDVALWFLCADPPDSRRLTQLQDLFHTDLAQANIGPIPSAGRTLREWAAEVDGPNLPYVRFRLVPAGPPRWQNK